MNPHDYLAKALQAQSEYTVHCDGQFGGNRRAEMRAAVEVENNALLAIAGFLSDIAGYLEPPEPQSLTDRLQEVGAKRAMRSRLEDNFGRSLGKRARRIDDRPDELARRAQGIIDERLIDDVNFRDGFEAAALMIRGIPLARDLAADDVSFLSEYLISQVEKAKEY